MTKKIGDKKIGGVKTDHAPSVGATQDVKGVEQIAPTSGVGSVHGAQGTRGKRRPTRVMTAEERDKLFKMVDEEAERLFSSGSLSAAKRDLVRSAVKMAVDSGLIEEEETPSTKKR